MDISIQGILSQYAFYNDAPKSLQDEITANAVSVKLKPKTFFYEKNSQCSHIALVGSGSVRVFIVGDTGREVTLYHVRPGESCPVNILSALLDKNAPAMAIVETPLEAVVLSVDVFRKWISEQPIIRQYVFEALASRLIDVLSLMEEITFRRMDHRLAMFLSGQFECSDTNPPVVKATHEQIAVELGSAREVISRLLREFEHMGIVELTRGRVVQKNKEMLHTILEN